MAVLQMKRINLVAMKQNRSEILARLQELGAVEINIKLKNTKVIGREDTSAERADSLRRADQAERGLAVLDAYAPVKASLFSSLEGKPIASRAAYGSVEGENAELMDVASKLIDSDKEVAEQRSTILKLENQKEALEPWKSLDIPMNLTGTERTALLIGTIGDTVTNADVLTALKTHKPSVESADVEIVLSGKDGTYLTVICLKEDEQAAEDALRAIGFAKPAYMSADVPAAEQAAIDNQIADCNAKIAAKQDEITALAGYRDKLRLAVDYYRLKADRSDVQGSLPQTPNTFALSGYIPEYIAGQVATELADDYGAVVEIEDLRPKEKPPVVLKNNKVSRTVEGIVESYGLPKKGEVDPTFLVSVFYIFLFGMMLSDAGYGALVVLGCGFALKRFPRMEEGLKKSVQMFFWCGWSTVFWGVMFGSYFGDLVQVVSRTFLGGEVAIPALWFEPLTDPMRLLIWSLLFGIIHMFVGVGLKGYMMLKNKDITSFVCDVLSWYMLLIGILIILLPTSVFESMSGMSFTFPEPVNILGKVMAAAGLVIILVMSGRRKKNKIAMRLLLGVYDIYGLTSWLSDLLSYSRLLALGLATGAIAQVINQLGTMFGTGALGIVMFVVIFVVGTVLNLAINLLGAYVHSNRLEYVEFFNKFYDGGGRPFNPFKATTKYVEFADSKSAN